MTKRNFGNLGKALSLFLAILILAVPILAQQAQVQQQAILEAEQQADRDTNKTIWYAVGCVGSILGLAAASLLDPKPPQAPLLGRSPEYVAAYIDAYVRKVKSIRTKYGLYGCGTSVVLYGLGYLVIFVWLVSEADDYYY